MPNWCGWYTTDPKIRTALKKKKTIYKIWKMARNELFIFVCDAVERDDRTLTALNEFQTLKVGRYSI